MAFADTAKLVASLELQDKFSKPLGNAERALGSAERKLSTLERVGFETGRGLRNTIDNVKRIGLIGAGVVATQVAAGVQSLTQLAEVENQTAAVLESTGNAANVTADQIRARAEALEQLTTIDDKAIQSGQNMLLTFTNIRNELGEGNDIFDQATDAVLDLSVAMGTEPKQAALQLGKALNDPVRGLTALRRVGVAFTDEQEEQIKAMVEAGDTMGAQKLILAELNKEFGKSAEAFGEGPGATMRRFGDAVEGAQQALARGFLPVMEKVSELTQDFLSDPKVIANIEKFGEGLAGGIEDLIDIGMNLPWDAIGQSAKLMGQGAQSLLKAFTSLPPWVQTAVLTGWGLNKLTGGALGNIAGILTKSAFGALRGSTPATPVFTKEVGIGGVGGPGGAGGGGFLLGATKFLGAIGLITVAAEALSLSAEAINPNADDERRAILAAPGGLWSFLGIRNPFAGSEGAATPIGQFDPANRGGTIPVHDKEVDQNLDQLQGGFEGSMRRAIDTSQMTLEQRLIRDKLFKQKITTPEDFIRILRRTSEFGEKGVGTTIEQGRTTGRDPVGDAFVALVGRLEKPALKSVEVQGEISRHITALEEVQGRLLKDGNIADAKHAQRNIDALHDILGTSDKTNAILNYLRRETSSALSTANRRLSDGNAKQQVIAQRVADQRAAINSGFQSSNRQLGIIASKDFSPDVNITNQVSTQVSINDVIRSVTHASFASQVTDHAPGAGFTR